MREDSPVKTRHRLHARALVLALGVFAAASRARAIEIYGFTGELSDAENLTFAVINGNLVSSNPEPGDLPLDYTATLTIDDVAMSAVFEFEGSFSSPTRSYTWDIEVGDLFPGITVDDATTLQIDDVFTDFDFSLLLDKTTGTGSWSWLDEGSVPSDPPADRSADGSIETTTFVPEPATALLLAAGLAGLARRPGRP